MATWQADVARMRWRADLFEYGAAAAGDTARERAKAANGQVAAESLRALAVATETFEAEMAATADFRKSSESNDRRNAAVTALQAVREMHRMVLAETNLALVGGVTLADGTFYNEPTDDELLGGTP